jgi:hypothetical protein
MEHVFQTQAATAAALFLAGAGYGGVASMDTSWTANDPFVGKWKLNVSRSTIVDQMVVAAAAPNKYTFRFEGGPAETIRADGTDQPTLPGTTLSVKAQDSRTLKIVRKQGGRIVISAKWKLSEDGRILHDAFTGVQPNGSASTINYVYRRMSDGSGFFGTWESTTKPLGLIYELQIKPYGHAGLSFVAPGSVKSVTFDRKDHAVAAATHGPIASGQRQSARGLAFTEKTDGKVIDRRVLSIASDGKSMTMNVDKAGQSTPNVLVFERE